MQRHLGNCVWGARVNAITAADADTYLEHNAAAATTTTIGANGTEARRVIETTIAPSVDSMAPDDLVRSDAGVQPDVIADLLGHVDTRMVFRVYRHAVTPQVAGGADEMERLFGAGETDT